MGFGEVGLIEIFREPEKLPYKVGKSVGGQKGIMQGEDICPPRQSYRAAN